MLGFWLPHGSIVSTHNDNAWRIDSHRGFKNERRANEGNLERGWSILILGIKLEWESWWALEWE